MSNVFRPTDWVPYQRRPARHVAVTGVLVPQPPAPVDTGDDANLNAGHFPNFNAALANVRANTAPARILFIGDSTTEGTFGANIAASYPSVLQGLLNSRYPTARGAVWGVSTQYDDDTGQGVTLGTGWSHWNPGGMGPNGNVGFTAATSASGVLSFEFAHSFDKIVVYYLARNSTGTCNVDVDGDATLGAVNTTTGSATWTYGSTTLTCFAGTHTINIHPPTVNDVFIQGVEAYLSTTPQVLCSNAGKGGTQTSFWVAGDFPWFPNPEGMVGEIDMYNPDLSVISLGINDSGAAVATATVEANLTDLVTRCQLYGDVLLCNPIPDGSAPADTRLLDYNDAYVRVAAAMNCGLVDLRPAGRFESYAVANANGYMADTAHPNTAGYAFWASLMDDAFEQITASTRRRKMWFLHRARRSVR